MDQLLLMDCFSSLRNNFRLQNANVVQSCTSIGRLQHGHPTRYFWTVLCVITANSEPRKDERTMRCSDAVYRRRSTDCISASAINVNGVVIQGATASQRLYQSLYDMRCYTCKCCCDCCIGWPIASAITRQEPIGVYGGAVHFPPPPPTLPSLNIPTNNGGSGV